MSSTTSAIPDIIDALFAAATAALPNVTVSDGTGVTDQVGDFLMIGVDDPDQQGASSSAESDQSAATLGTTRPRDETGTVTCAALSSNGDGDQKRARDAAFAMAAAVATICRTDPSLALAYTSLVTDYGTGQRLMQNQYEDGVEAILVFSVRFRARI